MKLKHIIILALFLNVFFVNCSYSQKYNRIDSIILKYPKNFATTEDLAKRIDKDFKSEYQKARAIFSWIALNLTYDYKTFLNPPESKRFSYRTEAERAKQIQDLQDEIVQKAFKNRKAVCEGFSLLYAHLADLTGLNAEVVHGDSKTMLNDIGRKNTQTNHAWNIVEIDGKWRLVDATWGQGYFDFSRKAAVREFKPFYFDTDPKYFFAKHYPDSGTYLDDKIDKDVFLNAPLIYNNTVEGDHEIIEPNSGLIEVNAGQKITFKIKNISKIDDICYVNMKGQRFEIENPKEKRGYLEFQVTNTNNLSKFITFFLNGNSIASFKIIPKSI
jgi:hypothetical protein